MKQHIDSKLSSKQKKIAKTPIKTWSRMTKAEKRVALAKDVIKQIKAYNLVPITGKHFELFTTVKSSYSIFDPEKRNLQVNEEILKGNISCEVCAKGALFTCHILKTDNYTFQNYFNDEKGERDIKGRLEGIISENQMDLIETAFERRTIIDDNPYLYNAYSSTEIALKAIEFGEKYESHNKRLTAIMNNMIKGEGIFLKKEIKQLKLKP